MIPLFKVFMQPSAASDVTKVLFSGFIGQGKIVDHFEHELNRYTTSPPVTTSSCTAAISAVLRALGVGPGDEVITTPITCTATNTPIILAGATPIWADVDYYGNIDPLDVARKITKKTKAIIAVNWTGRPAAYEALRSHGIPVIEDAAHGPLRTHEVGGDFVCYSFGPIKHLTCGDGGAVVTDDEEMRERIRLLRWYGLDRRTRDDFRCAQNIEVVGSKWHMNDINAAIGRANLPAIEGVVRLHQRNAKILHEGLSGYVSVPPYDVDSNYWVFPLLIGKSSRDNFKKYLEDAGIAASQVHSRNDRHTGFPSSPVPLPGVDDFEAWQLNIPCGWWVTQRDLDYMIKVIRDY